MTDVPQLLSFSFHYARGETMRGLRREDRITLAFGMSIGKRNEEEEERSFSRSRSLSLSAQGGL